MGVASPSLSSQGLRDWAAWLLARPLLATVLHHRLGLPQTAVAALVSVQPETINRRIREIRQLLEQAGHAIRPTRTGSPAWAIFTVWRPQKESPSLRRSGRRV